MYSPTQGRFITTDPIGFQAGDVNLYRFVGNHPTNATDPSGLAEQPPYPEKLGTITEPCGNEKTGDAGVSTRLATGAGPGGRQYWLKLRRDHPELYKWVLEATPDVIPAENKVAASGPGTNIAGGNHAFFAVPALEPVKYFGTGGCQGCVGLLVVCDRGTGAVFHFTSDDNISGTLGKYDWPKVGKCKAYVFGGDDTAISKGLFSEVWGHAKNKFGKDRTYLVDADHLLVGYDGKIWVRPPVKK